MTPGMVNTGNGAYSAFEAERHVHSYERWFEVASVPDAEDHVADPAGTGAGVFQIDAGNDTWGSWLQVLGAEDTPAIAGNIRFDLHRLLITATERNFPYVVQIACGTSGAAALAAGTYTEVVFSPASNLVDSGPVDVRMRRQEVGTKVWVRCICPGQDTATLDFFIGLHEYER